MLQHIVRENIHDSVFCTVATHSNNTYENKSVFGMRPEAGAYNLKLQVVCF